jgi:hypothetical protein
MLAAPGPTQQAVLLELLQQGGGSSSRNILDSKQQSSTSCSPDDNSSSSSNTKAGSAFGFATPELSDSTVIIPDSLSLLTALCIRSFRGDAAAVAVLAEQNVLQQLIATFLSTDLDSQLQRIAGGLLAVLWQNWPAPGLQQQLSLQQQHASEVLLQFLRDSLCGNARAIELIHRVSCSYVGLGWLLHHAGELAKVLAAEPWLQLAQQQQQQQQVEKHVFWASARAVQQTSHDRLATA